MRLLQERSVLCYGNVYRLFFQIAPKYFGYVLGLTNLKNEKKNCLSIYDEIFFYHVLGLSNHKNAKEKFMSVLFCSSFSWGCYH